MWRLMAMKIKYILNTTTLKGILLIFQEKSVYLNQDLNPGTLDFDGSALNHYTIQIRVLRKINISLSLSLSCPGAIPYPVD